MNFKKKTTTVSKDKKIAPLVQKISLNISLKNKSWRRIKVLRKRQLLNWLSNHDLNRSKAKMSQSKNKNKRNTQMEKNPSSEAAHLANRQIMMKTNPNQSPRIKIFRRILFFQSQMT